MRSVPGGVGTGATVWITGLPAAGKSTLAAALHEELRGRDVGCALLDGDDVRQGLCSDLGFTAADRAENVRRLGEVAILLGRVVPVVIVAAISPYRADRARVRDRHDTHDRPFLEVFCDTPLETCRARDPKGLYARAARGAVVGLTGVDDPYEPPQHPALVVTPGDDGPGALVRLLLGGRERPSA